MSSKFFVTKVMFGILMLSTTTACGVKCAGRSLSDAYRDPQALSLVKAAVYGDSKEVQLLVRKGANPNHLEEGAVPMLLWTICADNVRGFEALLQAGADPNLGGTGHGYGDGKGHGDRSNGTKVREGWSATVMAGGTSPADFLRLALQHGGDPNGKRGNVSTDRPLFQAAVESMFANIQLLVDAGADVNAHDEKFKTDTAPILSINYGNRYDIAIWLLEHGYNYDLQRLASFAEIRHVSSNVQPYKEKLIDMLRAKGAVFPASGGGLIYELRRRDVPPDQINNLVYGRRSIFDFPEKWRKMEYILTYIPDPQLRDRVSVFLNEIKGWKKEGIILIPFMSNENKSVFTIEIRADRRLLGGFYFQGEGDGKSESCYIYIYDKNKNRSPQKYSIKTTDDQKKARTAIRDALEP